MTTQHHRWVTDEPRIPFDFDVLYEDAGIIVIDKPHFLAVTPRGMWYRETALIRLRERYGEPDIVPAHRLDRLTAGVVVFVRDPALRGAYQMLFQERRTTKIYECLAPAAPIRQPRYGTIEPLEPPRVFPLRRRSRIVKQRGILQAYEEPGAVNAETVIELGKPVSHEPTRISSCASSQTSAHTPSTHAASVRAYTLHPRTGKTHQLRVHMNSLGLPIVGDDFYPRIETRAYDDFSQPLELVARQLSFVDPVNGEPRAFVSRVPLGAA
ncbi:pseudouridine synthase [Bifidobacterium biavatii]|uniref:RNA pseudouridylate synthase n=1 Tax=Bifidobacterium biavatii DSM 23969 TaxID=1437608 RepID=A0A087A2S0_9BIFI|nr:pseudouridine synthase [Bifidobacterium biavatii]KFI53070.1 23S RNA-specific pseudouridylate synthase [Bifidobacterium biavatii DSM 23969]